MTDPMYLQIGYSNAPIASGLIATQGGKSKDIVRVPPSQYVDAVFFEVMPPASPRNGSDLTRAEAAIRLYSTIFNYPQVPRARLCVSA
jgi:hypothetical protein